MCNCTQKRSSLKHITDSPYRNMLKVRLKENKPVVINGSITGRAYIFKSKGDINWVDRRDITEFKSYKNLVII